MKRRKTFFLQLVTDIYKPTMLYSFLQKKLMNLYHKIGMI